MNGTIRQTTKPARTHASNGTTTVREEVAEALERLSQVLVAHTSREVMLPETRPVAPAMMEVQDTIRFLGQVAAAWDEISDDALPSRGAAFGSTVYAEDLDTGATEHFTLMAGPLLDIDAAQVSLASPIGQALLGAQAGDVVTVHTPQRVRRLRVTRIRTLHDRISAHTPTAAA